MMANEFNAMVCTVGENPLPVYLGIAQLTTNNATIVLLHSEQTREQARRIASCVQGLEGSREVHFHDLENDLHPECLLDDPWDFKTVKKKFEGHYKPGYLLNITGGTNVMTSTGYHVWKDKDINAKIVYLEEKNQRFRFDNGMSENLEWKININILCRLHGTDPSRPTIEVPKDSDTYLEKIFHLYSDNKLKDLSSIIPERNFKSLVKTDTYSFSPLLNWIHGEGSLKWSNITKEVLGFWQIESNEIIQEVPAKREFYKFVYAQGDDEGILRNELGRKIKFVRSGMWFERLVQNTIIEKFNKDWDISRSRTFWIKSENERQRFEVDMIIISDNRLYVVSITTEKKQSTVKEKAFEAIHRAHQLGGGLARAIIVSPIDKNETDECQLSLDASKRHIVVSAEIIENPDLSIWKNELSEKINEIVRTGFK